MRFRRIDQARSRPIPAGAAALSLKATRSAARSSIAQLAAQLTIEPNTGNPSLEARPTRSPSDARPRPPAPGPPRWRAKRASHAPGITSVLVILPVARPTAMRAPRAVREREGERFGFLVLVIVDRRDFDGLPGLAPREAQRIPNRPRSRRPASAEPSAVAQSTVTGPGAGRSRVTRKTSAAPSSASASVTEILGSTTVVFVTA